MSLSVDVPQGPWPTAKVSYLITVSAKYHQRVTVTDNRGYTKEYKGQAEGNVQIGEDSRDVNEPRTYTVTAQHSKDGGKTWENNQIKRSDISTKSLPPITITTLSTEDGGDKDFDDSVISFQYLGLPTGASYGN